MAKRSGINLVVELSGTDITSAGGRSYEIDENPGEPEKVDTTSRGATARTEVVLFDGAPNTTISMNVVGDSGTDPISALTMGTKYAFLAIPTARRTATTWTAWLGLS